MTKRILIADDEEEIVELLRTALEVHGYEVCSTYYGGRVPELVKSNKPDLLICDVMMPGLDGFSLQLELSDNAETCTLPVIVMTALPATQQLFARFPQVKLFVNKPFDTDVIVAKVKELVGS